MLWSQIFSFPLRWFPESTWILPLFNQLSEACHGVVSWTWCSCLGAAKGFGCSSLRGVAPPVGWHAFLNREVKPGSPGNAWHLQLLVTDCHLRFMFCKLKQHSNQKEKRYYTKMTAYDFIKYISKIFRCKICHTIQVRGLSAKMWLFCRLQPSWWMTQSWVDGLIASYLLHRRGCEGVFICWSTQWISVCYVGKTCYQHTHPIDWIGRCFLRHGDQTRRWWLCICAIPTPGASLGGACWISCWSKRSSSTNQLWVQCWDDPLFFFCRENHQPKIVSWIPFVGILSHFCGEIAMWLAPGPPGFPGYAPWGSRPLHKGSKVSRCNWMEASIEQSGA